MKKLADIDVFSLCLSTLTAPVILVLFGLLGTVASSETNFFALLFWQLALALEYMPLYFAVSLPLGWLIWRAFPAFCLNGGSISLPLLVIAVLFALSANARSTGVITLGPFEPETFSFMVGILLNAIAFIWLRRRTSISTAQSNKTNENRA